MRILHVETHHRWGGTERNLLHTAEWQQLRGHEVHLALMGADGSCLHPVPAGELRVHKVPGAATLRDHRGHVLAMRELGRLVRRWQFDVVHTHKSTSGILGRLAARGHARAIVHTVHMASFGPGYPRTASGAFRAAERYCARFTDFIITVGHDLRDRYLGAGIGEASQYRVIRSPIDLEPFIAARSMPESERAQLRSSLGLSPDASTLLAAGLLERRKRHELMLKRLRPLLARGAAQLIIAGEGPEKGALRSLSRELGVAGSVRLLGYRRDLPALFAISDTLVHTSRVEGVPQVVIQALAAGVPVVASEVEGLREVPAAPLTIVARDARDLAAAVESSLDRQASEPSDASELAEWSVECVETELERFHAALEARVAARA